MAGSKGHINPDQQDTSSLLRSSSRYLLLIVSFSLLAVALAGLVLSGSLTSVLANNETVNLPLYAGYSLSRMTLAYFLSLAFALAYGITAALNHRASHVMLPLLDILQSVPVLAFLPVVFVFFLRRFPGPLGEELSSILLIFTAMAWAPTFGVIAGINSIPQDIKEAARAYGIGGFRYLRQIALPAMYPELVWTSILAWGGGWFFIPVEEYFKVANVTHTLPGIGFYIANAVYERNDLSSAVFGLGVLVIIIVSIDRFVWRPLSQRAEKYKYETVSSGRGYAFPERRVLGGIRRAESRLVSPIMVFFKYERTYLTSFLEAVHLRPKFHLSDRIRLHERLARHALWGRILSIAIFVTMVVLGVSLLSNIQPSIAQTVAELESYPGIATLFILAGRSILRILTAYLIALAWTLGAGILIARSTKFARLLVPLFDIGQSIPATALFPIIIILLVNPFPGNEWALEAASIVVLLAGMQWYLLFNIVGAINSIPTDLTEVSSAYRIKGRRLAREILLPASYPAIIIGSIQAWGGGWNTTIVSETVGTSTGLRGLGSLLVTASSQNLGSVVIASVLLMTATVVLINRTVWRRLLRKADKFKFEA